MAWVSHESGSEDGHDGEKPRVRLFLRGSVVSQEEMPRGWGN